MVELADTTAEAAWKIKNLGDYDRRLEEAARRVDALDRERGAAALIIYESVLVKSGRPLEEIRGKVRSFRETFEDEEEPLTIPRVSGILNVEGEGWFFGDEELRVMTGRLLGQFQHRVAQYNYIDEREVLRRWADGYDTRLFIRRRIYDTEPVVGVVEGLDLPLVQYLRVAAGGNTAVPTTNVARALEALGFGQAEDGYQVLARAEGLALRLDLPAPIVSEMLEEIVRDGVTDFPEPPREAADPEADPEATGDAAEETGYDAGEDAGDETPAPSGHEQTARRKAREDPKKGEEPTRVQDPQRKQVPGVGEEAAQDSPAPPETGKDEPGNPADGNDPGRQ